MSCLLAFVAMLHGALAFAQPQIFATVDPKRGSSQDQFTLKVTCNGCANLPVPDIQSNEDFDAHYLGPETLIINGRVSLSAVFILSPKRQGELKTPGAELEIEGRVVQIDPLTVVVSNSASPTDDSDAAQVTQSLNHHTVFKGEQVVTTVEILLSRDFLQPQLSDEPLEKFWQEPLGQEEHSSRIVNGTPYQLVTIRKALFPLIAGKLEVPPRVVKGKRVTRRTARYGNDFFDPFDSFFSAPQQRNAAVSSNALQLEVRELPPMPAQFPIWGTTVPPVGVTEIRAEMSEAPLSVGESRTLTLVVTSLGNISPFKEVPLSPSSAYRVYSEPPKIENFENSGALISRRTFKLVIVPTRRGTITIPEIALGYFNTDDKEYRIARTRSFQINVEGGTAYGDSGEENEQAQEALSSLPADPQPTVSSDDFAEPTLLQRLAEQIGISFAAYLGIAGTVGVTLLVLLISTVRRLRKKSALREEIERAATPAELQSALVTLLRERAILSTNTNSPEEIKAALRASKLPKESIFALTTTVDELSPLLYGGSADNALIANLKTRLVNLAASIAD